VPSDAAQITGPAKGTVAAWHAPGADVPWYPIAAMRWGHLPVIVALAIGGAEIIAELRRHPRTKAWWWYQIGVAVGDGWTRVPEIEIEMKDRASDFAPIAFRPLDVGAWAHPLPPPLTGAFGTNRPPVIAPEADEGDLDPHHGSDDWPYPGLKLGLGVPASREECEARLLRAFRTSNAQSRVGHAARDTCADIPREMVLTALKYAAREREAQERGAAKDLDAVRSGWTPTKRDVEDWETALSWLNHAPARAVRVVSYRAADPPWSFRQIAERIRGAKSHNTARGLYAAAIDHAFSIALRMPTPHPRDASAQFNGGSQ
jgi:hypothetical protein